MRKAQHTPGPWNLHAHYDGSPLVVTGDTGESWIHWSRRIAKGDMLIGDIEATTAPRPGFPRVTNPLEMEANARLIAAAPEMLAALERMVERIEYYSAIPEEQRPFIEQWEYTEGSSDMQQARAAIRKAKGEA